MTPFRPTSPGCVVPQWSLLVMLIQSAAPIHYLHILFKKKKKKSLFLMIEATHHRTTSIFCKLRAWQHTVCFLKSVRSHQTILKAKVSLHLLS